MQAATPVLFAGGAPTALDRVPLKATAPGEPRALYDERWLQTLIQSCPEVLPTAEIEPGFGRLIPVATEVTCAHGRIDNLFVTADGGIALVETKLWRNPQARREVVSQTLDYVAALTRMSYAEFERLALLGDRGKGGAKFSSLYGLVADHADALDEAAFVDAVSINLRRGRILAIAAGDGIRTETEIIADLLQSHAGARFTFALVAIELFKTGAGEILPVPRTIAKTVLVERGVVRIEDGQAIILPPAELAVIPATSKSPRISMTEELFMDIMAHRNSALPNALRSFVTRASEFGATPEWLASLNLKWINSGKSVNLGYVRKDGGVSTDTTYYSAKGSPAARTYIEAFAALCGGKVVQRTDTIGPYVLAADGRSAVRIEQLLPQKAEEWLSLIQNFIDTLAAETEPDSLG